MTDKEMVSKIPTIVLEDVVDGKVKIPNMTDSIMKLCKQELNKRVKKEGIKELQKISKEMSDNICSELANGKIKNGYLGDKDAKRLQKFCFIEMRKRKLKKISEKFPYGA